MLKIICEHYGVTRLGVMLAIGLSLTTVLGRSSIRDSTTKEDSPLSKKIRGLLGPQILPLALWTQEYRATNGIICKAADVKFSNGQSLGGSRFAPVDIRQLQEVHAVGPRPLHEREAGADDMR